jgi:hypothetical protein
MRKVSLVTFYVLPITACPEFPKNHAFFIITNICLEYSYLLGFGAIPTSWNICTSYAPAVLLSPNCIQLSGPKFRPGSPGAADGLGTARLFRQPELEGLAHPVERSRM